MGFRNFEVFNQALLAKQAWRLLTVPNSLCARVLKARYFKHSDILHAGCPGGGSFSWRSILHGRDLLKNGLIWRVGNGHSIDAWKSNWIPRAGLQRPLGRLPAAPVEGLRNVADFLTDDGTAWNEAKLRQYCFDFDVQDILKVVIGVPDTEDCPAWNYTKNGVFSVRSAYHFQMKQRRIKAGRSESSRNPLAISVSVLASKPSSYSRRPHERL
jgi:hypothetical protein